MMLPELSARSAFGTALPFTEFAMGALLVVGVFTRETLFAGGLLTIPLVFGTILRSEWATAGGRCYSLLYAVRARTRGCSLRRRMACPSAGDSSGRRPVTPTPS
jgi:hypothetical protein